MITTHRRFTRILGTAYKVVRVRASELDPPGTVATVDHGNHVVFVDERLDAAGAAEVLAECERAAQRERGDA